MKKITLILMLFIGALANLNAQQTEKQKAEKYISTQGELTFTFQVNNQKEIESYSNDFSIVNYNHQTKTLIAWANEEQFRKFEEKNITYKIPKDENEVSEALIYDVRPLEERSSSRATLSFPVNSYPTYAEYAAQMQDFEDDYPALVDMFSIGSTGQGDKELLFVKISDNVNTDEQEPKLMFTSSMHGDEIAGYPMMLSLINYILTVYSDTGHADHARVKNLVENAELWINPSANPDGTYHNSASNTSVTSARRGNGNNIDLNRNYPDNVAGAHYDGEVYQTETLAFMALADANHFVISANFHGGTELVNYPFDNAYVSQYTHPDGDWFEYTGVEYATHCQTDANSGSTAGAPYSYKPSYMTVDDDSNVYPSPGVTHGAEWYRVFGGRQDYMNYYHQCREVTIELSDTKILPESQLDDYWYYNRDALLDYLTQGTYGFTGTVVDDTTGNPIASTVTMVGHDAYGSQIVNDISQGDFYRPIKSGSYDILFEAPCYQSVTLTSQSISDGTQVDLGEIRLIPGAETPSGANASAVGSSTATVVWNAQSGNTFDFRYREFGSPTWTTITGLTTNTYNITGLSVGVQYEAEVRSICGALPASDYSDSILFTTQISYCTSASLATNQGYITNVTLNTIDFDSAATNYSDFTVTTTDLTKEDTYNFSISKGANQNQSFGFAIWIDYNHDGDFDTEGENVASGPSNNSYPKTGSFTVDASALTGNTRMRVSIKRSGIPTSCETIGNGEVEDYTVNIVIGTLTTSENVLETASVFPNPFNDSITVKLPNNYTGNNFSLVLYDISGRIINVDNKFTEGNSIVINNLNEISSGTYFLRIYDSENGNTIIKRLVKN
ncbi:M14 family zinc carboxypeptidase [Oceanihabitans sp.]|nr:M14 family zinc carboxypeptidase [Oceanihabitans sp.]